MTAIASPIVRGMRRQSPSAQARDRILSDAEIKGVWKAAECGAFGAFVRIALTTALRRDKIATMRWDDCQDGVWNIPPRRGRRAPAGLVCRDMARQIIEARPRLASNPFVFAVARGAGAINGFSR